jgi:transposase
MRASVLRPHVADCAAGVRPGDSLEIADRVYIMVDISDDTKIVRRRAEVTGVGRRRRWSDEEKGRIVAGAVAPDAVIADAARHTTSSHSIGASRCRAMDRPPLCRVMSVESVDSGQANKPAQDVRPPAIELMIGAVTVRVTAGAEARDVEAVLRAVWRSNA